MIGFTRKSGIAAIIAVFVFTMVFVCTDDLQASSPVAIVIDGNRLEMNENTGLPVIIDERTYVPLRVISENLGAQVDWISDTQQVIIYTKAKSNSYPVPANWDGGVQIVIDGQPLTIPSGYGQAYISKLDRVMLPLRAVGEALGCEVKWVSDTSTVLINAKTDEIENPVDDVDNSDNTPNLVDNQLLNDLAQFSTNLKLSDGSVINSSALANMDASNFSAEQLNNFRVYLDQLNKYPKVINLPSGETIRISDLSIMGPSILSAAQIQDWLDNEAPRIQAKMAASGREFVPFADLAELYIRIGEEYGIRGDIAFFQAVKETNYFQFTGQVTPAQNNYCGLWATGSPLTGQESGNGADPRYVIFEPGLHGATFVSPEAGVEAHIQHLYAYATKSPLPAGKVIIDPRFSLVSRGIAPNWQQLNARWAVPGTTYGQSIIFDYWCNALNR